MIGRVLLCGASCRAAAESAARAGYAVTALDAYGDLDQAEGVDARCMARDLGRPFTAAAAARACRNVTGEAVVYLSPFENHPRAIDALARGRALWGNTPDVVRRARDPRLLQQALRAAGCAALEVFREPADGIDGDGAGVCVQPVMAAAGGCDLLVKPLRSGGGRRIGPWRPGARVPRGGYLQQRIEGTPGALVFAAAGGRAVPLGLSRQLIGDGAFGASGYRYCGSIMAAEGDGQSERNAALLEAAAAAANALAAAFGLVGVNGLDFVARDGVPYVVELNPRWTASMELVERVWGLPVFAVHAGACADGVLPAFDLARARRAGGAAGKAVLYARRDVIMGDTRPWLRDPSVRDVPHPGERIRAGEPVCTVFAAASDAASCEAALRRRAAAVFDELACRASAGVRV